MTPDGLSDLLACVAAFGRSLDEHFDPARFLTEFSARAQRLVPHDHMLIAVLEDDGQTYSVFAEYADKWESYSRSASKRTRALCYKGAFKLCYY